MEVIDTQYNGYIPAYKRTQITDELHQLFGFRTDYGNNRKEKNEKYNKKYENQIIYAYSIQKKKSKKR